MNEAAKRSLATHVVRCTPLGLSPVAPGTVGSLAGLLAAWAAWKGGFAVYFVAVMVVTWGGAAAIDRYESMTKTHDDRRIVIDEVAGMMIALAGWPAPSLGVLLAAFAAFRFFDIVKPWPVSWIDRRVGGGLGVMGDDVAAGIFSIIFLEILRPFLYHLNF